MWGGLCTLLLPWHLAEGVVTQYSCCIRKKEAFSLQPFLAWRTCCMGLVQYFSNCAVMITDACRVWDLALLHCLWFSVIIDLWAFHLGSPSFSCWGGDNLSRCVASGLWYSWGMRMAQISYIHIISLTHSLTHKTQGDCWFVYLYFYLYSIHYYIFFFFPICLQFLCACYLCVLRVWIK